MAWIDRLGMASIVVCGAGLCFVLPTFTKGMAEALADLDENGDGLVDRGEFPGSDAAFARCDRDGDGSLSRAEVRTYEQGRRRALERAARSVGKLQEKFRRADVNGDGVIARDEFPAPDALFQRFDRDGNGEVSYAEGMAVSTEEELAEVFAQHDLDLSGTLTLDELPEEAHLLLEFADTDGDGHMTGEEAFAFAMEARLPNDGALPASPGAAMEPTQPAAADRQVGAVLSHLQSSFSTLDEDGDGRLDRTEFHGSSVLLGLMDVDGDGAVSRGELGVRINFARRLAERAQGLRQAAQAANVQETHLALLGGEIKAMFEAGRLEEVQQLMDEVELRLQGTRSR
jgi:Ca2+-binding EF-hand superfamily protein